MGLFDFISDLFNPVKKKPGEARPAKAAAAAPRPAASFPKSPAPLAPGLPTLPTPQSLAAAIGIPFGKLVWLRSATPKHYVEIRIPKLEGERLLEAPKKTLKKAQRWILRNILDKVEAAPAAFGFRKGRSPAANAAAHVMKEIVMSFDLRNFFWQIGRNRVRGVFQQMGYSRDMAYLLASLCCHKGRLPQGAPTSPALSNLVCRRLDRRLAGLAKSFHASYTRYADDLTFSGPAALKDHVVVLVRAIKKILREEQLHIAPEKTHFARRGARQEVTGYVVNSWVAPPREVARGIRALLHTAKKKGPAAANVDNVPRFKEHVRGRIEAVRAVNPERGKKLLSAFREIVW